MKNKFTLLIISLAVTAALAAYLYLKPEPVAERGNSVPSDIYKGQNLPGKHKKIPTH